MSSLHIDLVDTLGPVAIVPCWNCGEKEHLRANCGVCAGRGDVMNIPWAKNPWDEVIPPGVVSETGSLWIGGHDSEREESAQVVTDEFDLVVSLYHRLGFGPSPAVTHTEYFMPDSELVPADHGNLARLATITAEYVQHGGKVLVRCQAGYNRSALVTALAMVQMGWTPESAIVRIREVRSPIALFNNSFVDHILSHEEQR